MLAEGGYKLEKAIEFFNINLNFVCIDIGASTGDLQIVCFKTVQKGFMLLM